MISMDKEYRYRNGEPARVLCVDAGGPEPVISLAKNGSIRRHRPDGLWWKFGQASDADLIEVKPRIKREYWLNVYHNFSVLNESRKKADEDDIHNRLACVRVEIDCEEGEGL